MKALRRLAVVVTCAVTAMFVGASLALAQPPGVIPAGQYRNTSLQAGFFATSASRANLNVTLFDGTSVSAPLGGPTTTTHSTSVNIEAFSDSFTGGGCYQVDPSTFTLTTTAATLNAMITDTTPTCGPPGSIPTPFTVNVTWTGIGPVSNNRRLQILSCGTYHLDETVTSVVNNASAAGTLAPIFSDQFAAPQFQLLRSDDESIHAEGPTPTVFGCQPAPGIPGGAGPPPAGDYVSESTQAGFDLFDPTAGTDLSVFVTRSTQTSSPKGGPSTTQNEFDVRINMFGAGTFAFGCFELTPADFSSNGVTGATLSKLITVDTPKCQPGGLANITLPLTVNVVWTGAGPVASTRGVGTFTCLTYRSEGNSLTVTNIANVTASLTPLLSSPVTTDQGSLVTNSSNVHAEGAQQPACHL